MCSKKCASPLRPGRIVHRAHAIPDHLRDDGRAVVGDDDHLHPVLHCELKNFGVLRARRHENGRDKQDRGQKSGEGERRSVSFRSDHPWMPSRIGEYTRNKIILSVKARNGEP